MTILDLSEQMLLEALDTDTISLANYRARLKDLSERKFYLDLIEMVTFKNELEKSKVEEPTKEELKTECPSTISESPSE